MYLIGTPHEASELTWSPVAVFTFDNSIEVHYPIFASSFIGEGARRALIYGLHYLLATGPGHVYPGPLAAIEDPWKAPHAVSGMKASLGPPADYQIVVRILFHRLK
jgi:hypothetical protein